MGATRTPGTIVIGRHERGKGYPVTVDGVLAGHVWPWANRHWSYGDVHDPHSKDISRTTRAEAAQLLADHFIAAGE